MSPWAEAIAGNLFLACLIGGLAWCVGRSGRRSRLAHTLWLVFFVKLITPPIIAIPVSVPQGWWPAAVVVIDGDRRDESIAVSNELPLAIAAGRTAEESRSQTADNRVRVVSDKPPLRWTDWFWIAWAVGSAVIVVRGLNRLARFHRLLQRNGIRDDEATRFVRTLLRSKGADESDRSRRGPQVVRLPVRVSPMLFGLGSRPIIVCPDQLWASLSERERHAFLAHEAAHYRRRDHWVRWLEWIVTAVYWWFPGVYIARRQLERHEEACCDAWAVRKLNAPPRLYAEALLRVIDFISEHRVGIPRLASGMQPTSSLEERLHLVMKGSSVDNSSKPLLWSVSVACLSLWLVHPVLHPHREPTLVVDELTEDDVKDVVTPLMSRLSTASSTAPIDPGDLPEPPTGFWNRTARPEWASFSLALPGARLVAEANRGITIRSLDRIPLRFSSDELSAVVEIPSTKRVVIGDAAGRLRLWDLAAGMPVSLIGIHPTGVSSVAYHAGSGLVSGDHSGSVVRWDLQSGHALATWADSERPVQSIRHANDGQTLAILTGPWNQTTRTQDLHLVDGRTLQTTQEIFVPPHTAVVLQSPESDWVSVDWSGRVRSLLTGETVAVISKHRVSALVLCQQAPLILRERDNSPVSNHPSGPSVIDILEALQ